MYILSYRFEVVGRWRSFYWSVRHRERYCRVRAPTGGDRDYIYKLTIERPASRRPVIYTTYILYIYVYL